MTSISERPKLPITIGLQELLEDRGFVEQILQAEDAINRLAHVVQQGVVRESNVSTIGGTVLGVGVLQEAVFYVASKGRAIVKEREQKSK